MQGNNLRNEGVRSRAIVLRCSDRTFLELLQLIRTLPNCYLVFSKSSDLRLVVDERSF